MKESFAQRAISEVLGTSSIHIVPTSVEDVVTFKGSFDTQPRFDAGEELVQEVTVALLDKGTHTQDRFAIAEQLENCGAHITYFSDGPRCGFSGRALRKDLPLVLRILFEQLREPRLDADEFEKARARVGASLQRSLESTGSQANAALSRSIFNDNHPNYTPDAASQLHQLAALDLDTVRAYHARHFGATGLHMVCVGDTDAEEHVPLIEQHLAAWEPRVLRATYDASAPEQAPQRVEIPLAQKNNLDVRFGHALPVRRDHPDFVPLYISNYILGGNFSARLMASVRDEQGLTYGIGSTLAGVTHVFDGLWRIRVTLSQENLERGMVATRDVIERYVAEGATEAELNEKKTTIVGAFKVGLATTGGLASSVLVNVERGFGVGYLDQFPALIEATTLEDVHQATMKHFRPELLHTAVAGTLPELAAA